MATTPPTPRHTPVVFFTCPMEPGHQPPPLRHYQPSCRRRSKVEQCKARFTLYTTLLVLEVICTLVLGKLVWSLYSLLQEREGTDDRVDLTRFSYRKEFVRRPLPEAETVRL